MYLLQTRYGDWYKVDDNDNVIGCDNGLNKENATEEEKKTWKIIGISKIGPFNSLGPIIPLSEAVKLETFRFKNGKPMYAIHDIDHGTHRVHGNFAYHGCTSVSKV